MTFDSLKKEINPILERQGVNKAAIFGSFASGEAREDSDIDIVVSFEEEKSLFDLVGLKLELEDKLKRKVDVLTYNGLNHRLKEGILKEQRIIYEKE
ncbi:MAG: type VII toxin-antitoxin system MntA family adenylyltransferase antitoxin [Candidatus Paceibacterota bacterium]